MTPGATAIGIQFRPVDTWYFSDGTPSPGDSSGQQEVGGVFPPHPATVVGAVRAALARANGWSGQGAWPTALIEVLGDGYGPESLGTLAFDGPYLLQEGVPHHPVPAHLLGAPEGERQWRAHARLRPGAPVSCDLGEVRLPEPPDGTDERELRPSETAWLPEGGLAAVLRGGLPDRPAVDQTMLWQQERRVGIARCAATRTVREGMLYTARHVRLEPGVAIGIRFSGLPPDWRRPPDGELVPFGGEGRLARLGEWDTPSTPTILPAGVATGRITVVALTPLDVGEEVYRGGAALAGLGGATVVSACMLGAQQVGGWRTVPPVGPLPMRSVLPPGSVLFCEGADPDRLRDAVAQLAWPPRIGERQRWGFGAVALGAWPGNRESTVSEV